MVCRICRRLLSLAAALLLAPAVASADVGVSIAPGLGGFYRRDRPLPVEVTLDNSGGPARARVLLDPSNEEFPRPAYEIAERSLPAGARWRGFAFPPAAQVGDPLRAELWVDGRRTQELKVPGQALTDADRLVVACGPDAAALASVSSQLPRPTGAGNRVPAYLRVAAVPSASMPDRAEGLAAADLLLLAQLSADELSSRQQRAIADWVAAGGTVVISGGPQGQLLRSPFYSALLPVRVTGSRILSSTTALREAAGVPGPTGLPLLVTQATPLPGRATRVLAQEGTPLFVRGRRGLGQVVYLAFDPLSQPFRAWDGAPEFWRRLATGAEVPPSYVAAVERGDSTLWNGYGNSPGDAVSLPHVTLGRALDSVTQAELPGLGLVAGFLIAYIVALVPVNYLVLRRLRRKEWAWITSPAIVLLFTGAAYAMGSSMHGSRVTLTRVAVVETTAGATRGRAATYAGLFAPGRGDYTLAPTSADWRLLPVAWEKDSSGRVVAGDPERLADLHLDTWEQGSVRATGPVDIGGGFRVERAGTQVRVRNDTPFSLDGCALVWGENVESLGEAAPGKTVVSTLPSRPAASSTTQGLLPSSLVSRPERGSIRDQALQERRLRAAVVEAFAHPEGYNPYGGRSGYVNPSPASDSPLFVGWSNQPVTDFAIDGRPASGPSATLFIVHLPAVP